MSFLKNIFIAVILVIGIACSSSYKSGTSTPKEEPVVIANDSLEYEIIIIDPGFTTYLNTIARPKGFHSQIYLENRNRLYVPIWNMRVSNPSLYNPNIYENRIDYDPNIDYGYDVNYQLFNYFQFAQRKYRMTLR